MSYVKVAVCLGGRFSLSYGYMKNSHKLRNLKDAATQSDQFRYRFISCNSIHHWHISRFL